MSICVPPIASCGGGGGGFSHPGSVGGAGDSGQVQLILPARWMSLRSNSQQHTFSLPFSEHWQQQGTVLHSHLHSRLSRRRSAPDAASSEPKTTSPRRPSWLRLSMETKVGGVGERAVEALNGTLTHRARPSSSSLPRGDRRW